VEERDPAPNPLPWPPRRVALATLIVVGIAAAFWIVIQFRLVFFSLFIAIVLSTAVTPLVTRLERTGIPRSISLLLVALFTMALIVVFILLVAPLIIEQWAQISALLSEWYQDLRRALVQSPSLLVRRIARQLPLFLPLSLPSPSPDTSAQDQARQFIDQLMLMGGALLRSMMTIVGVGLLVAFWILEGERNNRFLMMAVPQLYRETVREFMADASEKVRSYTRGLVMLSLVVGVLAMVAYMIIGLPNVLLLGILAGIMEAVPLVGPLLGAIPAIAVAISYDPEKVIWVVAATVIIQSLENYLIVPRVMNRAVGVNPVAGLLAFLTFGAIFGFTGALLAIPLAALIQLILNQVLFQTDNTQQDLPIGRDRVSMLRYEAQNLVQDVRKQVRDKETELEAGADLVEDAMEAIVLDLDSILAKAEQANEKQP
jgi:predicted PurR-regulated permease PerM